jgi:Uma2 family endonuclease
MSSVKPTRRRWSVGEYDRLAEQGLFAGQRVELINGEIISMPAQKGSHVVAMELAETELETAFGAGYWIRTQAPLNLGRRSMPEPDLAVVPGNPRDYSDRDNPTSALLVVEVSDSTLAFDRGRKASVYARAGIADYWIVNLIDRRLEVRRLPIRDTKQQSGFRYSDVAIYSPNDGIAPLAAPSGLVRVAALLP